MSGRLLRNPLALAGAMLVSALLGAGAFALLLSWMPGLAGPAIRGYLLEHPEVLPEAMDRLQARETARYEKAQQGAQAAVPQHRAQLETPFAGAWAGNPKGDVTVVAFMDYACGYCRASLPGIEELLAKDPNVRVVYREFPVLGPESVLAARWALAAAGQGKFRAFHDALFAAGQPSAENIALAVEKAGLDKAVATKAIESKPVEQEIAANHKYGELLAMTGTPSWVVGGKLLSGARDYAGLAAAVAEARAAK
ncbi:protein-disulfide isomerase [Sphingomonas naasensis]|uniref:DsbA family protein n=1 Tax=Sphingomonas naasensis TaxID=1344951 RepID=A0A4S1WJA9_9SPHN|nr:DsbA family protein [Sphingomonas naasensis]NIJ21891.1 protein-disulfide isomerase [Sphingomonas naasensis]TGX42415.1 DsbA family protein [Sphingomonas naasensis]